MLQAPSFGGRCPQISHTRRAIGQNWIADALADHALLLESERERALTALQALQTARIGGTFWAGDVQAMPRTRFTLLRPRTPAGAQSMLRRALAASAACSILVCAPDRTWARRLRSHLDRIGVAIHLGAADPWPLLDHAATIEVEGEDPITLLAITKGVPVRCAVDSNLAGWGLTLDAPNVTQRGVRTLADAAHVTLIAGTIYRNPFSGRATHCEDVIEILSDWRRVLDRTRRIGCCTGMALWKRGALRALLHTGDRPPAFRSNARAAAQVAERNGGGIAVWTSRAPRRLTIAAEEVGGQVFQVEDGFLRSVGLGSNLTPPWSIVVDTLGAHYDPSRSNDLETLLSNTTFDQKSISRAERLIDNIDKLGLTKYNVGSTAALDLPRHRKRVLVAGQVEGDLSVRFGGAGVTGNLDLLARVRAVEPDALILFKPHPDVEAGQRGGAIADADALRYADRIIRGASMAAVLPEMDAVHVLTSLAGFEALLRGRTVVTHGQPFYAGWGLTHDRAPPPRRDRRLTLAELVAGALILYPLYLDPITRLPCSPELLVTRLAQTTAHTSWLSELWRLKGRLHPAFDAPSQERPA